jgi:hypothetical protein
MSPTTRRARSAAALMIAVALASACGSNAPGPAAGATTALDPATTGTVRGRVTLDGPPPVATTVRMDGDKTCATFAPGAVRANDIYVVGPDAGLANVFVHVTRGLEGRRFPVPQEPVVLDQQKCWYVPRVVGVRVGQPFQVLNSDPLLHNVRANSEVNEPFDQGQPVQGVGRGGEPPVLRRHRRRRRVRAARPAGRDLHGGGMARSSRHPVGHRDGDGAG